LAAARWTTGWLGRAGIAVGAFLVALWTARVGCECELAVAGGFLLAPLAARVAGRAPVWLAVWVVRFRIEPERADDVAGLATCLAGVFAGVREAR